MLLIVFSSLILVAKGTMQKANKWQDNWHAQVLLLHINKADSKYELSEEIAVLQFNPLKISSKLILRCRMEKQAWETHWKCQEGRGATESPSHISISQESEKALSAEWQGRNGIRQSTLLAAALHSLHAAGACPRDSSVITGAVGAERLLKQKDIPTNLTAATDWIIHAQLGILGQASTVEVNYHNTSIGAAQPVLMYPRSCKEMILTVSPWGLRLSLWA